VVALQLSFIQDTILGLSTVQQAIHEQLIKKQHLKTYRTENLTAHRKKSKNWKCIGKKYWYSEYCL